MDCVKSDVYGILPYLNKIACSKLLSLPNFINILRCNFFLILTLHGRDLQNIKIRECQKDKTVILSDVHGYLT